MKEEIRRLKCKALKLVDELRPRLTGHINYLQKRYSKIQEKIKKKENSRSMSQLNTLKQALSRIGLDSKKNIKHSAIASVSNSGSDHNPHAPKLFMGKYDREAPMDEIKDEYGRYFVKIDIIEELCVRLTPEEIDLIAEDPKFYFPATEEGLYDELWDIDKWNYIADRFTGRLPPNPVLDGDLSLPLLRRLLPAPRESPTIPKAPRVLARTSSAPKLKLVDWHAWVMARNVGQADKIGEHLEEKVERQHANKKAVNVRIRHRLIDQKKILELKMVKGAKNSHEKYKQMIEARNEKQMKALKNRQELEERLQKIRYNEEMLAMNKRLKELCKNTNQLTERRKLTLSPEPVGS